MGKIGFFNDGNTNILFQNSDGSVALWDMSGVTVIGGGLVSDPGPTWHVEGTAGGVSITPGSGSFNVAGNIYSISTDDIAEENGSSIPFGTGTTKLVYYNGLVYGLDAATANWFIWDGHSWFPTAAPGFFGDGNTATILQNNNGSVALWDMSGTTVIGGGLVSSNPGPTWHIKGTGVFFGDGSTDILLQNDDGSVALWDMNATTIIGGGLVSDPGPTWHIEATGSFFGTVFTGIVLQNDDGSVALWDMFGTSVIGGGLVSSDPGPTWHVKGTGDFFGDGNTDILLQNDNGSVALWDVSGTTVIGGGLVSSDPGPTWHVKGTGDYFGDGHTDILLQNDNGSIALWDMKGTNIIGGGLVGNPGSAWNAIDNTMLFIYSTSANETLVATPTTPDEFVFTNFAAGSHTIDGFNPVQDMIEFSKTKFASFADVQAATSPISGGVMINLGNGSSLLLPGVNAASLHASNFALA
jgi:hypothetical protein